MTTISGIGSTTGVTATTPTNNNGTTVDETGLFETNEPTAEEIAARQAEIARLEAQIQQLNNQRAQYVAEKKELEAQKKSLETRKAKLEAEIAANNETIKNYQAQVKEFENEREQQKAELAEFKRQYNDENKKANDLNKKMQEKLAELLEQSKLGVENRQKAFDDAKTEAEEKVKSGEITQEEVSQYIAQKLGVETSSKNAVLLNEINTLNTQIKASFANSAKYLNEIGIRETNINELDAKIASGNKAIQEVTAENTDKNSELASVNDELNTVNSEISSVQTSIASIDTQISTLKTEIAILKASTTDSTTGSTGGSTGLNQGYKPDMDLPDAGDNKVVGNKTHSNTQRNNPFVGVSFEQVEYGSIVETFEVLTMANDNAIESARQQVQKDEEQLRNFFQQNLKK